MRERRQNRDRKVGRSYFASVLVSTFDFCRTRVVGQCRQLESIRHRRQSHPERQSFRTFEIEKARVTSAINQGVRPCVPCVYQAANSRCPIISEKKRSALSTLVGTKERYAQLCINFEIGLKQILF